MLNRFFCLLFLWFMGGCPIALWGQDSLKLRLFFHSNADELPRHRAQLDLFLNPYLSVPAIIGISGYADFVGESIENFQLSQRRANKVHKTIQEILEAHHAPWALESPLFFGESLSKDNGSSVGDSLYRSVCITLVKISNNTPNTPLPEIKPAAAVPLVITPSFEELKAKGRIDIPGIGFTPGRDILISGSSIGLDTLASQLLRNPEIKIEIRGHVCCTESAEDGIDLSTGKRNLSHKRADAVLLYLMGKGIPQTRMKAIGMARKEPKFPLENNTDEQQGNRRVEVVILR